MRKYSASQLTLYRACNRSWWFRYVANFKVEPGESQKLGTAIHGQIERYLLNGALPEDPRARAGLEMLAELEGPAAPGTLHVEGGITLPLPPAADGTERSMVGFIDVFDDTDPSNPIVTDHKTTSDMKWAKTEYELAEDVQLLVYAKWAIDRCPDAARVTLRHNVIPTKGRARAVLTSTTVDREHVERAWSSYLPILAEMDAAHAVQNAADIAANGKETGECQKFHGCPHLGRCNASFFRTETVQKDTAQKETSTMTSIQEKLAAIRAKNQGTAPSTTPTAAEAPKQETPKAEEPAKAPATRAALDAAVPAETAAPATSTKDKLQKLRERVAPKAADAAKKPEPAPVAEDRGTPPAEPIVEVKPTPVAETPKADLTGLAAREASAAPAAGSKRVRMLLLNCVPSVGVTATPLETFLQPILDNIRAEKGMGWNLLPYREGPGLIVEGIQRAADAAMLPEVLAVDTTTGLGKVALEGLMHRADLVIAGRAA